MEKKPKFYQEYIMINPEIDFGYLIVIESINDIPTGRSYIVKIPKSHCYYDDARYYVAAPN